MSARWLVAAVALASMVLPDAAAPALATPYPNIPIPAYAQTACLAGPGPACEAAYLEAINAVHLVEHIPPLQLPGDFGKVGPVDELLEVINAERVSWGLPAAIFTQALDSVAEAGAIAKADPRITGGAWGSVEAELPASWHFSPSAVLLADYCLLWWDGPDSPNQDKAFVHTQILLGDYGARPYIGAGVALVGHIDVLTAILSPLPNGQ